jgi:hypothetical protein
MATEEEIQKRIDEAVTIAREQQARADFGRTWFAAALSYTAKLVQSGELPAEAHNMGLICYNQFMGLPATPEPQKPDETPA